MTDERISQFTMLPAGGGEEEVMAMISSEARSNVRKAARHGVSVELDNGAMEEVCEIHEETMRELGGPAKSRRFFEAIPKRLRAGEDFDIWTARAGEQVAAALLVIRFNGVSEYFTSGTLAEHRKLNPHAALVFTALVNETRNGSRIWNWGGTRDGMDGVFHFKRKWGSREGRYRYFVRVNDRSLLEATPDELLERFPNFYVLPFSELHASLA
jgi:lipid II:glycine glycyltransferase (peptidoglycan interpeptide bridge formation enzyme)